MTDWQGIGTQIAQTGTALRFTGKNAYAIMVMFEIVPIPIPFSRHLHTCRCCFFAVRTPYFMHGKSNKNETFGTSRPPRTAGS